MIHKITFTGKAFPSDIIEKASQGLKGSAEKYFGETTLIEDIKPYTSSISRFANPYEFVNIAENKTAQIAKDIPAGFHINYFG